MVVGCALVVLGGGVVSVGSVIGGGGGVVRVGGVVVGVLDGLGLVVRVACVVLGRGAWLGARLGARVDRATAAAVVVVDVVDGAAVLGEVSGVLVDGSATCETVGTRGATWRPTLATASTVAMASAAHPQATAILLRRQRAR